MTAVEVLRMKPSQVQQTHKVAVITGSGRGIGKAIALRLAQDGFHTVISDIDAEGATRTAQEFTERGLPESIAVHGDVSDPESIQEVIAAAETHFGGLAVVVANAGIAQVKPLIDVTPDDARRMWDINISGTLWTMQAAARQLIRQGRGGKIIVASSIAAHQAGKFMSLYAASKFAVTGLVQAGAKEWGASNITVNAYCPGIVNTDMWKVIDEQFGTLLRLEPGEYYAQQPARIALGYVQQPEDVADYVSFLSGSDSDYMTGQSVNIDGGIMFS
jgi:meso-butanediol dehydrogenase/(S,S)-butanediol dehydrogenase/diacetyl reductase